MKLLPVFGRHLEFWVEEIERAKQREDNVKVHMYYCTCENGVVWCSYTATIDLIRWVAEWRVKMFCVINDTLWLVL